MNDPRLVGEHNERGEGHRLIRSTVGGPYNALKDYHDRQNRSTVLLNDVGGRLRGLAPEQVASRDTVAGFQLGGSGNG